MLHSKFMEATARRYLATKVWSVVEESALAMSRKLTYATRSILLKKSVAMCIQIIA